MSNLRKYVDNYDRYGLKFLVAIKEIGEFEKEKNTDTTVNVLGVKGRDIYIKRKSKYYNRKKVVNLSLIADGEKKNIIER